MNKVVCLVVIGVASIVFSDVALAATETVKIYAGEGDGYVMGRNYTDSWDEVHDRTTAIGTGIDTEGAFYTGDSDIWVQTSHYNKFGLWSYVIVRPFLPFDTSIIPDNAEIDSVKLNLYPGAWRDGSTEVFVVKSTQESINKIINDDFDQAGEVDNPEIASSFRNDVPYGEYAKIEFNNFGKQWIEKNGWTKLSLRTSDDALDMPATRNNGILFHSSEASGTDKDPYLEITYTVPDEEDEFPLYTQITSEYPSLAETVQWADDSYADGKGLLGGSPCGATIANCGCAITSLTMMARSRGIEEAVDGSDVNPGNFNTWLSENNGYDPVGNIFWSRAADYFGEEVGGRIETPFTLKNHKVEETSAIRSLLEDVEHTNVLGFSGRYGHYVYLKEASIAGFIVKDPLWYLTNTSNDADNSPGHVRDYNDTFRGVAYAYQAPVVQKGIIEATLNSPAELLLVDSSGNKEGVYGSLIEEIGTAEYVQDEFIDNPEEDEVSEHRTKRMYARDMSGQNELRVVGTGNGEYTLAITGKTEAGDTYFIEFEGDTVEGLIDVYGIDMATGKVNLEHVDRELLREIIKSEINNPLVRLFFLMWGDKIFDEIEAGKFKQAKLHIMTFRTLLKAKKVKSPALEKTLERLEREMGR